MKTLVSVSGPIKDSETILAKCLHLPGHIVVNSFDEPSAKAFRDQFNKILEGPQDTIPIIIDSYGGQVFSLISMIDTIDAARGIKKIITSVTGKAMSCGAILLAAGDQRFCSDRSDIMIHEVSGAAWGKNVEVQADSEYLGKLNKQMLEYLSTRCGKKPAFFGNMLHQGGHTDLHLSAKEAKKLGLVHTIGTPSVSIDVSVKINIK